MYLSLGLRIGSASAGEAPPGPVNIVAPVISGTPGVGETLTSTTGTWAGTGTITYANQWRRDGVNIGGATASTYVQVEADQGTTITNRETATDDLGSRGATSNAISVPAVAPAEGPFLMQIEDGVFTYIPPIPPYGIEDGAFTYILEPENA